MSGANALATETLTGRVKWYDSVKGYGFVAVDDDRGDVLLHANCLRRSGVGEALEGATVTLEVVEGERGRQAIAVVEVASSPADAQGLHPIPIEALSSEDWLPARVKWFDRAKGFGFLNVFGDKDDVFVHMETLRAAHLSGLDAGEAIATRISDGPRGKQATEVTSWENIDASVERSSPSSSS